MVKLSALKLNTANPRVIKDHRFKKLVKSVKEFPKMMALRPIVIDKDGTILGGNMRYRALLALGYKEVPDEWVKRADELTDEEKQRFVIEDNVQFGDWDWEKLANEWETELLKDWGIELQTVVEDEEFENNFNKITNDNCVYPLVPKYDEKYELFIIYVDNEIDANWLRERFKMQKMKSYKNGKIGKSNVIHINDIKDVL